MKLNIVSITGGLGNQMFQYSFYLSLKYSICSNDCTEFYIAPYKFHNGYELDKVFDIKKHYVRNLFVGFVKKYLKHFLIKKREESVATYQIIKSEKDKLITYYSGYWQSEKYFIQIEDKIRDAFGFDVNKISDKNKCLLKEMKYRNTVSLHVRRGDYVNDPGAKQVLGGNCDLEYYKKCISYIDEKIVDPYFYIFSDDMKWTKDHFHFLKNSCFVDWNEKENSWQDMMLMSNCKHNIIANSSFSWWGAWLNSNADKIVLTPSKWFNIYPAQDIIPDEWIKI